MGELGDGGPAYPQNDAVVNRINNHDGMSLRDYFAGQALAGACSDMDVLRSVENSAKRDGIERLEEYLAGLVYKTADAMLAERAKKAGGA